MDERQGGRLTAREVALARAARVKRWVAGGAVALTGIFSAVAAHALPASHASSKSRTPASAPASPTIEQGADDEQQRVTPIAPPAQAPQSSTSGGGAVSGGS